MVADWMREKGRRMERDREKRMEMEMQMVGQLWVGWGGVGRGGFID